MSESAVARPVTGLDAAFSMPTHIREEMPDLGDLYDEMVANLRTEAFGIPMTTMQTLLIERIATKYIVIRYRERVGWVGTNAEAQANQQWSDLMKEWNRLLAAGHEQLRESLLKQMETMAQEAVDLVEDQSIRQLLRRHFAEKFAGLGF